MSHVNHHTPVTFDLFETLATAFDPPGKEKKAHSRELVRNLADPQDSDEEEEDLYSQEMELKADQKREGDFE